MSKPTIYVETSVLSYLASKPSRDLIVAANQQVTADWRAQRRNEFDLYVSTVVVEEAAGGDTEASARRLAVLTGIQVLEVTDEAISLASFSRRY